MRDFIPMKVLFPRAGDPSETIFQLLQEMPLQGSTKIADRTAMQFQLT